MTEAEVLDPSSFAATLVTEIVCEGADCQALAEQFDTIPTP